MTPAGCRPTHIGATTTTHIPDVGFSVGSCSARRDNPESSTKAAGGLVSLTPLTTIAADDGARTAGAVVGRLLIPLLGAVLLVLGVRRRRDRSTPSRGKGLLTAGSILLLLGVLALLGALAAAPGSTA